jgi:hypothetical protein
MAGVDTDASNRRRKDQDIVTNSPKENTSPEKRLAVEVAALRARVAELEAGVTLGLNKVHVGVVVPTELSPGVISVKLGDPTNWHEPTASNLSTGKRWSSLDFGGSSEISGN